MPSARARVRARRQVARGYMIMDVAIASVVSLLLAASLAPSIHEVRHRGMDTGLAARLQLLRGAVWMFRIEHADQNPAPDRIAEQLVSWTSVHGATSRDRTAVHVITPYLREIPPLTVGARAGARDIGAADAPGVGWTFAAGIIRANTAPDERDSRGVPFLDY